MDTIVLLKDIRTLGFPARKKVDVLLRSIYQQASKIERAMHRHILLRNIDFEKSGILLNYMHEELPRYHKKYKEIYSRLKTHSDGAIRFLRDELALREQTIAIINKGNEKYETKASTLSHVYLKEGISKVDAEQFYASRDVEAITLPKSIQSIIHTAFNFKQKLSVVYITSPRKVQYSYNDPPGIMTYGGHFYVPKELLESYKSDMFWKEVSERIFPIQ